ncbi:FAD/NAD(P)-binding domain-containing protein, partial [Sarocladium strictum]
MNLEVFLLFRDYHPALVIMSSSSPSTRATTRVPDLPSYIPSVSALDDESNFDATKPGQFFLESFARAVKDGNWAAFADLFSDNCFWKDNLTITFDRRTLQGKKVITEAWKALSDLRQPVVSLAKQDYALGLETSFVRLGPTVASLDVPFCFTTEAPRSSCVGLAKLIPQDGTWRIWLLSTAVDSLQDFPFATLPRLSPSAHQRGVPRAQGLPEVDVIFDAVVIGASMTGVATTIMLESIGLSIIAFDSCEEAAGNWSEAGKAYVTLHHSSKMATLPQYPLPSKYATDLGGKGITEYVSSAVEALKLPVFCGINVISNTFDEATKLWKIVIEDRKTERRMSLQTKNVVLALGPIASPMNSYSPPLSDRETFDGPIQHSTEYKDAAPFKGRNVVVVGASNSAHDIASDLAMGGAKDITILQRGPTAFFQWDKIAPMIDGPFATPLDLATADFLYFQSMPLGVARDFAKGAMAAMEASQSEFYAALEEKGYSIQRNRCFVTQTYETRNGHFFMDRQNHLDLVFKDRIRVARGEAIGCVPGGLTIKTSDEEEMVLKAEGVVLATGFETVDLPAKWASTGFVDAKSASKLSNPCVMEVDSEGESLSQCTRSGHDHLYYASPNVVGHRWTSRLIAIQITADVKGISPTR